MKSTRAETPKLTKFVPMPSIKESKAEDNKFSLEELAAQITARGNDMEVRSGKDGLKVFEISKKLIMVIAK